MFEAKHLMMLSGLRLKGKALSEQASWQEIGKGF
jgi:hypothetical protein